MKYARLRKTFGETSGRDGGCLYEVGDESLSYDVVTVPVPGGEYTTVRCLGVREGTQLLGRRIILDGMPVRADQMHLEFFGAPYRIANMKAVDNDIYDTEIFGNTAYVCNNNYIKMIKIDSSARSFFGVAFNTDNGCRVAYGGKYDTWWTDASHYVSDNESCTVVDYRDRADIHKRNSFVIVVVYNGSYYWFPYTGAYESEMEDGELFRLDFRKLFAKHPIPVDNKGVNVIKFMQDGSKRIYYTGGRLVEIA